MQKKLKRIYNYLQNIEDEYGDSADAWWTATKYLESHNIDDYFMVASGVTDGDDIKNQCENEYVDAEADDPDEAKILKRHMDAVQSDQLYEGNTGLDAYNRHPEAGPSVEDDKIYYASADDIALAFKQMKDSLKDFPERYLEKE